jgi:serine O-acetyltransferase
LPKKNITAAAHSLTVEFLGSLPRIREILQTDVEAAYNGDPAAKSKEEIIVSYPFIEAIAVQRLAHELVFEKRRADSAHHDRVGAFAHGHGPASGRANRVALFRGPLHRHGRRRNGHHRRPREDVSRRDARREIHRRVEQLRGKKRHPTIEDRVTIYPGATILGGETVIGAGSTIGGNVFIMDSVAPKSLVIYDGLDMRVLNKAEKKKAAVDFQI